MEPNAENCELSLLLRGLRQAYSETSWHGTNLGASLSRVPIDQALWRPQPERHNIWELTLHCAYWKYSVLRRLIELPRASFPRRPSNFPALPEVTSASAWRADRRLLNEYHERLLVAVTELDPARLDTIPSGSETSIRDLILGVAAHDLYHAGQIQLLKRLYKTNVSPSNPPSTP